MAWYWYLVIAVVVLQIFIILFMKGASRND